MSEIKEGYVYTKEDEWIHVQDGIGTVGLTDFAQDSLSDVVYVELPGEGDSLGAGDSFGVVESVKASSELYSPVSGEVVEVNEALMDTPEVVNSDPYGEAWLIKIKLSDLSELDELMDAAAYAAYCEERA